MVTVAYSYNSESKLWIVYGTKMINGNPITRQFEIFRTEKGAKNYCDKYSQKQQALYAKKRG